MRLLRITAIIVLLLAGCGRATPVTPSATPTAAITATHTVTSTATPAPTLPPPTATAAPTRTPASAVPGLVKLAELGKGSISPVFRSPDGKRVIFSGIDGMAHWYDAESGQEQGSIDDVPEIFIFNATFNSDSSMVALETLFGLMLVNLDTGKVIYEIDNTHQSQNSPIFSPTLRFVAFQNTYYTIDANYDTIDILRMDKDVTREQLPINSVYGMQSVFMSPPAISPDGGMIVSGCSDRYLYIWDAESAEIRHALSGHSDRVLSTAFRADGKMLASLDRTGAVRVWEPLEGKPLQAFSNVARGYSSLAFDSGGMIRLSGGKKLTPALLNPFTGSVTPLPPEPTPVPDLFEISLHQQGYLTQAYPGWVNVAISPDGSEIAAASRNILLWDRESHAFKNSIELESSINSMAYSPDGTRLAVSLEYKGIRVLDTSSGKVVFSRPADDPLKPHAAYKPAFTPDGMQIAFGIENRIEVWDLPSGKKIKIIPMQTEGQFASQVAFSDDGSRLYSILNWNDSGQVWDITSGKLLTEAGGAVDNDSPYGVSVFTASDLLPPYFARNFSGGNEPSIEVWNLDTGQVARMPTEYGMNDPLVFSPDGNLLFAGETSQDEIWIIDTQSGNLVLSHPFPEMGRIAFRPDLGLIASLSDGVVDLLDIGQLLSAARENSQKTQSIDPIADLSGFTGEWSPTANQLAGIRWEEAGKGYLAVPSAPDFAPTTLLPEFVYAESTFGHEVTWKPDGAQIVFSGPAGLDEIGEASALWAVKPSGEGARRFLENASPLIWMKIPGWLDANTMILSGHMGGDSWLTRLVDFESGKIFAQEIIPGEVFPGQPSGAPFEYHVSPVKIGVITTTQQGDRQGKVSYVRMMPESERMLPPQNRMMDVLGWQPGTDTLLVSVETLDSSASSLEAAQVVAWNIMTDEITQLAPKAGYAEYSPNGRWLALMAYNDLPINPDLRMDQSASPDVWKGFMGPQLYLVDQVDGKVKLHVPVGFSYRCCNDSSPSRTPWAAFSPDGRHMAFITYGAAQVNQAVPPEKEPPIPELKFILNVLDLETLQITINGPCPVSSRFEPTFLWSPDGENLFYKAGHTFGGSGPGVLNVISGEWIDININPNLNVESAAWSHDGTYLSLQASLPQSYQSSDTHTLIYKIK